MLDIKQIRAQQKEIERTLRKRLDTIDFTELLAWDEQRRKFIAEAGCLKATRNEVSARISQLKKAGQEAESEVREMRQVAGRIRELDATRGQIEEKIQHFLERVPNIPDEDVPAGGKENNQVMREWGGKPEFDFECRDHVDLVERLGLVDYQRGAKIGGRGFWLYRGDGARLEWALLNYLSVS